MLTKIEQRYLSVTTAEALKLAVTAPQGTVFRTRLRLNLNGPGGVHTTVQGVADLDITRETFRDAVGNLLKPDDEDRGIRIPLTVQESESGEFVYWIG